MKKTFFVMLAIAMAGAATAQRTLTTIIPAIPARSTLNTTWYQPFMNTADGATISTIVTGQDLWLRNDSHTTNILHTSGDTTFSRGGADPNMMLFLNANMTGRIFTIGTGADDFYNNGFVFGNNQTTLVGLDDPTLSSVTGFSGDRGPRAQKQPDNAVTFLIRQAPNDQDPPKNVGSYTFVEGNYFGGSGRSGGVIDYANTVKITGSSFVAGDFNSAALDEGNIVSGRAPTALWVGHLTGSLTINNITGYANDRFEAGSFTSTGIATGGGTFDLGNSLNGGSGLYAGNIAGGTTISGGTFIGSQEATGNLRTLSYTAFDTISGTLTTYGGPGAYLTAAGAVTINGGEYIGGDGGVVTVGGPDAYAASISGAGLFVNASGITKILGGYYEAGRSGSATVIPGGYYIIDPEGNVSIASPTDANGQAYAYGSSGIFLNNNGSTTVSNVTAIGAPGSSARASAQSQAYGGSGITSIGTPLFIDSGTFTGANGGNASGDGNTVAIGGAGAYVSGGDLVIRGGTFRGGAGGRYNGNLDTGNLGLILLNASLTMNETTTNTLVDGNIYFSNTGAENLTIQAGTINGDIYKYGLGTTTVSASTNASYNGSFVQFGGTVNVALANQSESKFFSKVAIMDGSMNFNNQKVVTQEGALFELASKTSLLNFSQGAELSKGTRINAGFGKVTSGNNLTLGENSSVTFNFDSLNNVAGSLSITGSLIATNLNSKIMAFGTSSTPTGSLQVVTATGGVVLGTNSPTDVVDVDFGWLTQLGSTTTNGGIKVAYEYSSLTNTSLKDLDAGLLTMIDDVIVTLNTNEFYALNAGGAANGTSMFRYSLSQMPDVSESSFQVSQKVNEQIAARGTEFRSMNGFASTQPRLGQKTPAGAAGPEEDKDMQGWVRAYGAFGNREEDGNFTAYDSDTWGSVIGVDKSFGNILVGLAGGYARTDIDGGGTYEASVDTFHGSVYSTIGGESLFLDLAATYARANTEEHNAADPKGSEFDSDVYSGYIGLGKSFDLGGKLSLTPEASMLVTYYDQQSYDRSGVGGIGGTVESYDAWSYMGTLGASVSTLHQIDWMNRGLALIPEVRAHWLHDFNADPDDFTFNIAGTPYVFGVRPREEDLLRIGFGFDIWSWKFQSTKFEIDYDALLADKYYEHILSGKISVRF